MRVQGRVASGSEQVSGRERKIHIRSLRLALHAM